MLIKHLGIIVTLCMLNFPYCAPLHKSEYSNLMRISELQLIQRLQLANPLSSSNPAILEYNECLLKLQEGRERQSRLNNIFGPFFLYKVEGVPLKLSFENTQREVQRSANLTDLILDSPSPDLSTYYCSWLFNKTEILDFMWTPEIIPASNLQKVPSRNWTRHAPESLEGIKIRTHVEEWSHCSKCGIVGKRHRIAYCTAQSSDVHRRDQTWQVFEVYSTVSCNLFLNLHPEIGSLNQKASQSLARRPQVLVGYCKLPCTHYVNRFNAWQEDLANSTHPVFHHIYSRAFDEPWEYDTDDNESDESEFNNRRLSISDVSKVVINFKDIPVSKEYIPEIVSFSALIILQLFICIQIYRNRRAAK